MPVASCHTTDCRGFPVLVQKRTNDPSGLDVDETVTLGGSVGVCK